MPRRTTSRGLFFAVLAVAALAASAAVTRAEPPDKRPDDAAGASATSAADPAKKVAEPQVPVRVSADAAEYLNKEGLVIFTGNVVAVQADSTITADRMEITFDKTAGAEGKPAPGIGSPAAAQRITTIVAQSKVSFRQVDPETGKERYATGDKGVYDVEQRVVTMSGSPRLWEGKNVIVGEEMIFHLVEKKVFVKGKVNLTVYGDDLKEEKKP
jgi:lipopolysaccharide export system protein LptA